MTKIIRVAAFQSIPKNSFEERKQQIYSILKSAEKQQIDFICFPEGFLTGYYSDKATAYANSIEIKDQNFQAWLAEIKSFPMAIIIGFNERNRNNLFNSVAMIEKGQIRGIQRKHYLYHNYFTPGAIFTPITIANTKVGVMICLDANYFEPAHLLALQGATIIFCPMCNKVPLKHPLSKRPPYYSHFAARSFENRCWIVAADWYWPDDGESICPGHSVIYDPDGQETARSAELIEELLTFDIPQKSLFERKGKRIRGSSFLWKELNKYKSEYYT